MTSRTVHVAVALLLIVAAGCGGPEERKASYRSKAQAYIQQGNFPKARVALRNVLRIDPKDPEAYFLFAQVEEKEKNWRNAFANYQRVVELAPNHERALIKLGKLYLEARMTDKVVESAERVLAADPRHAQARALKIAVLAVGGRLQEATAQAEALLAEYPTEKDAVLLLAGLYAAQQRAADAEAVLRRATDTHPGDLELLNSLASTYVRMGDAARAEQILTRIVEAEPKVLDHRVKLAGFYDQRGDYDKAEAVLRDAVRADPDSEPRRLALADFLATRRGAPRAEAALLEAKESLPHSTAIRFALGRLYESMQQRDKARRVYEEVRDDRRRSPASLDARVRLAAMDWEEGRQQEAERELQEVLKENPRASDALLLQGRIALRRGDGKGATQSFRTVLKDQPDHAEAYMLLGRAHLALGEMDLARENLEKAVALNPRLLDAQLALAHLDMAGGRTKDARSRLEGLLKLDTDNLAILGMLLNLQAAERDWGATAETIAKLRRAGAGEVAVDLAEGNLLLARQEWDKALAAFERAAAAAPAAPEPLFALVRLEYGLGRQAQAQARLEGLLARDPQHPYALGLLGELLLIKGDQAGAEAKFREAARIKPDWAMPWMNLATLKLTQQRLPEAIQLLTEGVRLNRGHGELRLLLASALEEAGQIDRAIEEYDAMLRMNPRALVAANNLAALLADHKGDPKSLERALALSREFETQAPHPFFLDTLGWVHLKLGHRDEAVRLIRLALSKVPDHPVLNYHLGVAYYRAGLAAEAKAYLRKAIASGKAFPGVAEAQTMLAQLQG